MRALHSRKDVTSMLNQFVQVSILSALLVLFLEEHLQCQVHGLAGQRKLFVRGLDSWMIRHTSRCCNSVKVCIYSSKYF